MNIIVNGRNVEVTPALKKYAEGKIGKFEKYLTKVSEAVVTLSVQKFRHKAEVQIKANGHVIQAESVTEELYSAIDEVADKLDRQVKKLKGKVESKKRKSDTKERVVTTMAADEARAAAKDERPVIRRKKVNAKPILPEDAALVLESGKAEFHVFTNAATGDLNVIYKGKDGNYALVEPSSK